MRYLDWDVLVFPSDSKAPLQEFRTACFAVTENDRVSTEGGGSASLTTLTPRQFAVLSCFIPSQTEGSYFKISVHSWEAPELSAAQTRAFEQGKVPCFEIRVYVDGIFSANDIIEVSPYAGNVVWPRVLERSLLLDRTGEPESHLLWPKFHEEMLTALHWNAAEGLGRIKVMISEGYGTRQEGAAIAYSRIRSLITFSFQHAPLGVLENCRIAWPNKSMWQQNASNICRNVPGGFVGLEGLHGRNIHRRLGSKSIDGDAMSIDPFGIGRMVPPPLPGPFPQYQQSQLPIWSGSRPCCPYDPFIDTKQSARQRKSEQSDVSMPDWSDHRPPTGASKFLVDGQSSQELICYQNQSEHSSGLSAIASLGVSTADNTDTTNIAETPMQSINNAQQFRTCLGGGVLNFQPNRQNGRVEDIAMPSQSRLTGESLKTPIIRRTPKERSRYLDFHILEDTELITFPIKTATVTGSDSVDSRPETVIKERSEQRQNHGKYSSVDDDNAHSNGNTVPTESKRKRSQSISASKSKPMTRSTSLTLQESASPVRKSPKIGIMTDFSESRLNSPRLNIKVAHQQFEELENK